MANNGGTHGEAGRTAVEWQWDTEKGWRRGRHHDSTPPLMGASRWPTRLLRMFLMELPDHGWIQDEGVGGPRNVIYGVTYWSCDTTWAVWRHVKFFLLFYYVWRRTHHWLKLYSALILFTSETPKVFCGLKQFTHPSIGIVVSRYWVNFSFWVNYPFFELCQWTCGRDYDNHDYWWRVWFPQGLLWHNSSLKCSPNSQGKFSTTTFATPFQGARQPSKTSGRGKGREKGSNVIGP